MENVLSEELVLEARRLVEGARRVAVCAHPGPDGDAVGSSLALAHWLRSRGKEVEIVLPNAFPDFLACLPGADGIRLYARHEEEAGALLAAADLIVVADLNAPGRLAEMEAAVTANPCPKLLVDHHPGTDPAFCSVTVSRPDMCATGEVLCHLLRQMGELDTLPLPAAECLYAAMMCDTGAFTYNSSRPAVYDCVGSLLRLGVDKDKLYRDIYWTATPARLRLQGYLLYVKLETLPGLRASIMSLTLAERKALGARNGDTEGMVNLPLTMRGYRLSVFLSEDTEHERVVKVSLRSVGDFPCNRMAAEHFGGGGHLNAAGGRLGGTMDEALARVRAAIKSYEHLLK